MNHPWNLVIYAGLYTLQVLRILEEERLLATNPEYAEYMQKTKSRLIPGVF
ncbi:hypothetical protein KFU94_19475 [Chloroflexi bacterium TSY]|nr:hypothetical protein [Chloroflexi bacterium TSY]